MRRRRSCALARLSVVALALAACSGGGGGHDLPTAGSTGGITVTSTAFDEGGEIPVGFTCDGANLAPPVAWAGASGRASIALVMTDPDARGVVHWLPYPLRRARGRPRARRTPPPERG